MESGSWSLKIDEEEEEEEAVAGKNTVGVKSSCQACWFFSCGALSVACGFQTEIISTEFQVVQAAQDASLS